MTRRLRTRLLDHHQTCHRDVRAASKPRERHAAWQHPSCSLGVQQSPRQKDLRSSEGVLRIGKARRGRGLLRRVCAGDQRARRGRVPRPPPEQWPSGAPGPRDSRCCGTRAERSSVQPLRAKDVVSVRLPSMAAARAPPPAFPESGHPRGWYRRRESLQDGEASRSPEAVPRHRCFVRLHPSQPLFSAGRGNVTNSIESSATVSSCPSRTAHRRHHRSTTRARTASVLPGCPDRAASIPARGECRGNPVRSRSRGTLAVDPSDSLSCPGGAGVRPDTQARRPERGRGGCWRPLLY